MMKHYILKTMPSALVGILIGLMTAAAMVTL